MKTFILLTCVFSFHVQEAKAVSAYDIVRRAKSFIGSRRWLLSADHDVSGVNTNKCNLFVADVLKDVGADAPNRWWFWYSPIGANEWGNPSSSYLTGNVHWQSCSGNPAPGDVIADGGHVGIVTGNKLTTSASALADPQGLIVENNWGFKYGQRVVCWRYKY